MKPKDKALLDWANARSDEQAVDAVISLAQQGAEAPQYEAFPGLGVVQKPAWDEESFWQSVDEELARLGYTREDLEADS